MTFLTGGVEHDQAMFFLFQGLAKVLRAEMADPRGPVLPGLLWRRGGLWTAKTEDNYPYLQRWNKDDTYNTTKGGLFHSLYIHKCSFCLNISINGSELPFINLQKSGSVGNRHWSWTASLTCAWTRWSCLYFGAVAACTSLRLSQSISDLGSRRSWSDLLPPCAWWRPLLPTRRDSGEISNNKP